MDLLREMQTWLVLASVLTPVLEIVGLWAAVIAIYGGGTAALGLLVKRPAEDISLDWALGSGAGFLHGIVIVLGATIIAAAVR